MKSETDFTSRKLYLCYLIDYFTGLNMASLMIQNKYGQAMSYKEIASKARQCAVITVDGLYPNDDVLEGLDRGL